MSIHSEQIQYTTRIRVSLTANRIKRVNVHPQNTNFKEIVLKGMQ